MGAGSTWTNSDRFYVGNFGSGTLNITGGGTVSNTYGFIGYESGSTGEVQNEYFPLLKELEMMKCSKMWIFVVAIVFAAGYPVQAEGPPHFHGINFSPYTNFPVQDPPPAPPDFVPKEKIEDLLAIVQPHTSWVRTFGAESGLEEIPEIAHDMGLKVAMGAYLGPDDTVNDNQIRNLIAKTTAGFVDIAVVGNETQVFGALTETQLVNYLKDVRQQLDIAGFTGIKVTTAEPFGTFVNSQPGSIFNTDGSLKKREVIDNVDVVFLNIYPFFEDGIQIPEAVSKFEEMYLAAVASINDAFPDENKQVVIAETGWPSAGDPPVTGGLPSLENAIRYRTEATQWAEDHPVDMFYFEAFDEAWKGPGSHEKHFGIWEANGQLKVPELSSITLFAMGAIGFIGFSQRRIPVRAFIVAR
jgi:exo-beta-1,3-glucanase (GH17 family)